MKGLAGVFTLLPGAAFACALPPSVILTLPTGLYMAGAAAVVALTAVMMAATGRVPALGYRRIHEGPDRLPQGPLSYLAFVLFLGLVALGFVGAEDPMHNPLTLVFWTGVWVALPMLSLVFGDLWRPISPWRAPVRMVRVLLGRRGGIGLVRFGQWPAVIGLAGFSWFLNVSLAPQDPEGLARLMLGYFAVIFLLAVAEGEDWLDNGEFLTVFFALIARVAPLWRERSGGRVASYLGWPGAQVLGMPPLTLAGAAFVSLALASLSFDGLSETFFWMGLIGENPLEFTGRSAVQGINTAGLLAAWAVTAGLLWGALALGRRLGGARFAPAPLMLSCLAIAAGYHIAHHLVVLLGSGQFLLMALNDPLFRGDEVLGLPTFYASFGFLTDPGLVRVIYATQFAAILGAHLLAVLLVMRIAGRGARAVAHLPMTALMVVYTVFGLWLLSTARGI